MCTDDKAHSMINKCSYLDRSRQKKTDVTGETRFNRFVRSQSRATVLVYNVRVPRFITEEVILRFFLLTKTSSDNKGSGF
jgi:hypothetical protein